MSKKIIITIDGWSSCGKSTLAKQLAKALFYLYVDSGAMYRAITLYFLRNNVDLDEKKEIKEALKQINLEFIVNLKSQISEMHLNGENVEYLIRDLLVAEKVSDYTNKAGDIIKNEWVTEANEVGKKYAFCADTKYDESLIPHITNADMIYHETTYLDNLRERAESRFHSTTKQAALIAQKAKVKKLLIGHFSSKYDTLEAFEKEAREIFPNTELALEGAVYIV